jgi:hypothetical protein
MVLRTVVLGTLALALSSAASADDTSLPFVVSLQGNANPTPTADPCILLNTETGTGQSAYLGPITWESKETVDLCANGNADVDGQLTITTANGDQVSGTYRTSAYLDFQAGVVTAVGRYKLTGGTGSLAGVKGKGVIAASGSLLPPFGVEGGLFGLINP